MLHLELVLKSEWIAHHDLEADIKPMSVEFDRLVGMHRRHLHVIIAYAN